MFYGELFILVLLGTEHEDWMHHEHARSTWERWTRLNRN